MAELPRPADDGDALLAAARAGDAEALGKLLTRYRAALEVVVAGVLRNRTANECSSVLQEGFLVAIKHLHQFRGQTVGEFLNWLRTIVRNKARDHGQRLGKFKGAAETGNEDLEPAADQSSPSQQAAQREQDACLHAAVERLPVHYREVIRGRCFDGLSYQALAARLETTEAAVRQWWVRAVRKLRVELGDLDEHGSDAT